MTESDSAFSLPFLEHRNEALSVCILFGGLIVGYNGLYQLLFEIWILPEQIYRRPSIIVEGFTIQSFTALLVVPSLLLSLGYRHLTWNRFDYGRAIRWLVLLVALPLVWTHTTYSYNLFLDQPHHFDRAVLLLLYGLIWVHPAFAYPFSVILFVIMGQFTHPFGSLSYTDKMLPLNLLILFCAFLFIKLIRSEFFRPLWRRTGLTRLINSDISDEKFLLWGFAAMIGASYFTPFVTKAELLWPFRDTLAYYIPLKYTAGWLGHLPEHMILDLYTVMQTLDPLGRWGTIAIQGSALALMWRKRGFVFLIFGFVVFHTLVFTASGIAFWKWIIADLAFLAVVLLIDSKPTVSMFTRRTAVVVTILILLSPVLFNATALGWFSTNYDQRYSIEVVSEDGTVHDVHWSEMQPYLLAFGSNRFDYLANETVVEPGGAVTTDYRVARALADADDVRDIATIKERYGVNRYDPNKAEVFDRFVRRYFESYLDGGNNRVFWSAVNSPPHFASTASTDPLPRNKTYTHVRVRATEYLVTDETIKELNSTIVRRIPLDDSG